MSDGSFGKTKSSRFGGKQLLPGYSIDSALATLSGARTSTDFNGEFDPGSGPTLAACLTHASRAVRPLRGYTSGERVRNTSAICPSHRETPGKTELITDTTSSGLSPWWKFPAVMDELAAYQ